MPTFHAPYDADIMLTGFQALPRDSQIEFLEGLHKRADRIANHHGDRHELLEYLEQWAATIKLVNDEGWVDALRDVPSSADPVGDVVYEEDLDRLLHLG